MHISYMHAKCTIRNLVPYLSSHLSCRSSAAQMVQTYVELLLLYAKYCTYACLYRWLHFIDCLIFISGCAFIIFIGNRVSTTHVVTSGCEVDQI